MTDVRSRVLRLAGGFCAAMLIAGLLIRVSPEAAQSTGVRIRVSFPASLEAQRIDGRLLVMLSTDAKAEPRFQITDDAGTQLVFGIDVDGLAPGTPAVVDAAAIGYPMRSLRDLPAGTYTAQALLHRYETFRRADGHVVKLPMDRGEGQQWNRAPGNLYSTPVQVTIGKDATVDLDARQGHRADSRPADDQVHPPRTHPQREALEVLGTRHVPRRARAGAGRLRHAPRGTLPADDRSRALSVYVRGVPRGEAGPDAEAGLQRPLQHGRLQPVSAAGRPRSLQGMDRRRLPARAGHPDPAPDAVLRRLLRRQLGQRRALGRRDRRGVDSAHREEVPRHRAGLGALHVRRLDGRLGGTRGAGVLPGRIQRRLCGLPGSDRLPRLHRGEPVRGHERVLRGQPLEEDAAAGFSQLARARQHDARGHEPARTRARHEDAFGPAVGRVGGDVLAGRRGRVPEADLGQGDRADRQGGGGVLEGALRPGAHHAARLGEGARPEARRARSTSTSATWTTTT